MTPIDRIEFLAQSLRTQSKDKSHAHQTPATTQVQSAATGDSVRRLRGKLQTNLRSMKLGEAGSVERAAGIFVDALLAEDFGAGFLAQASGQELASQVRTALLENETSREALRAALVDLAGGR